jgi:hypothetical protein
VKLQRVKELIPKEKNLSCKEMFFYFDKNVDATGYEELGKKNGPD